MDSGFGSSGELFFGVVPDDDTAAPMHRLASILRDAHRFGGEPIECDRLHVTLLFLGKFSQQLARLACEAAAEVRMPPFALSFDRSGSFGGGQGKRPLVFFGDETLKQRVRPLRQTLGAALLRKGIQSCAHREFTPHLTLIYGECAVDEHPVAPIGWTVTEFVLIHSLHGHTHLARWPLDV
jgi:2'-5' RNA ligase